MASFIESKQTILIENAQKGNLDEVLELLREGANVNATNTSGETALILASRNGFADVVKALLKHHGVNVDIKSNNGNTALINASYTGHLSVVSALLKYDRVEVNIKGEHGSTALIAASWHGHLEVVRALLKHHRVDVNILNNDGNTALIAASWNGHLEVVRDLLDHHRVDVNILNNVGNTALITASWNGHLGVVDALLNHDRVEVNIKGEYGSTALIAASWHGRSDVVRALLNKDGIDVHIRNNDGATALESARKTANVEVVRLLKEHMAHAEGRNATEQKRALEETHRLQEEPRPPRFDMTLDTDQKLLLKVMNTTSADPVELSAEYIQRSITDRKLGSGAFGDVLLAEDNHLPKKFAVKRINLERCDEGTINNIRDSFQKELSTLKRFHHPNIIVLYGYNLNVSLKGQFLVYEYAANGSLDRFLRDDGNRARLPADTRLSIMFEMARAVHFLHTGGCSGWKVFHRDIKSPNICLAEDFTARLIDCGLAKFVPDENSNIIPGSVTPSIRSTSGLRAFGTPGYMCPVYARIKARGLSCPYIAAFDVYSIGVVIVELILGCLTGGQSTRNGKQFLDVFEMYVQDERTYLRIVDGCEKLKRDADPAIIWNPEALELVCKTAIRCMAPVPEDRLSTDDLLGKLSRAIQLQAGIRNAEPDDPAGHGCPCVVCNRNRASMQCSEGHALCSSCIEEYLLSAPLPDTGGHQVRCLIDMCSSQPLQDKDLYRNINVGIFIKYIIGRELYGSASPLSNMNELLQNTNHVVDQMHAGQQDIKKGVDEVHAGQHDIKKGVDEVYAGQHDIKKGVDDLKAEQEGIKEGVDEVNAGQKDIEKGFDEVIAGQKDIIKGVDEVIAGQKKLATGLNWALGGLSLLTANEFRKCPNLVVIIPSSVAKVNWRNPKKWVKTIGEQQFTVQFFCGHSHQPGHDPFEISETKKWIVAAAPWLKMCLQVLAIEAKSQCLPCPIPDLSFLDQFKRTQQFYDSLMEGGTPEQMKTLEGEAFHVIEEKANKKKRSHLWKGPMVCVNDENGAPIWVKQEYRKFYQVDLSSSAGIVEM
ncbi:serine/threonine kinase [Fragilaria crotonensis]|nr:serine/threonine kinase [Fragilaria crotonensis]